VLREEISDIVRNQSGGQACDLVAPLMSIVACCGILVFPSRGSMEDAIYQSRHTAGQPGAQACGPEYRLSPCYVIVSYQ